MGCKVNPSRPPILCKFSSIKRRVYRPKTITFCSSSFTQQKRPAEVDALRVDFKTLGACKLGISRYPDFEYNAEGGIGTGNAAKRVESDLSDEVSVSFDIEKLFIPPLTSGSTRFLGLPLPPFLKIEIAPEFFQGSIDRSSGKVDLEFKAKFWFTAGNFYRAPPLLVETVLTSEESEGIIRRGKGERLNNQGKCKLVGVATVEPIDDFLMNTFLGLPTECLAILNAVISFSPCS